MYIIYSKQLDKYYIGETSDLKNRLEEHRISFYENSYTSNVNDWIVFFKIVCETKTQAIKIEKHIKSMKSRTYVHNLKNYPEIANKLKEKYLK
ncbi:MAG: GIY-YIG nuclease family protein [Flavobacteriaceae bacterium]|nr:GIY-YIG nuclease family protein [Flavobacteriaceae bacterium]